MLKTDKTEPGGAAKPRKEAGMENKDFQKIINGSMRYEFAGTVLTVSDYRTGKEISIDLGQLTDETFEELVVEEQEA
jgi:hypothetical protein